MSETRRIGEGSRPAATLGAAVLVTALWFILQAVGSSATPFYSKGEPREAIVVQDIAARGDWILPRRNGFEIVRKPPLFYWLGALTAQLTGRLDEGSVRLPSALQSWAACMLLIVLAAAGANIRTALLAALVLLTSFEWLRSATTARVDMTLALGTTASFVGLTLFDLRRSSAWLLLAYAGMVWGTLAKGPVAIALPVLFVVARAAWRGGSAWVLLLYTAAIATMRAFSVPLAAAVVVHLLFVSALLFPLRGLAAYRPLTGLVTVAAVTGLWYALAALRGGLGFFMTQIVQENFARFTGGARFVGGHEHSPLYLIAALLAGLLPWTPFLPMALGRAARRGEGAARRLDGSALLWCAVVFVFFSFAESKRSVYLLPMYPALALLVGRYLDAVLARRADEPADTLLRAILWPLAFVSALLAFAFAAEALGLPLVRAAVDTVPPPIRPAVSIAVAALVDRASSLAAALGCAAAIALAGAALTRTAARRAPLACYAATCVVLMIATQRFILPAAARADTRRDYAAGLASYSGLAVRPDYDYATAFYRGGIPVFTGRLAAGPRFLLVRRDAWRGLDWPARRVYQAVAGMDLPKQNNQPSYFLVERLAPTSEVRAARLESGH